MSSALLRVMRFPLPWFTLPCSAYCPVMSCLTCPTPCLAYRIALSSSLPCRPIFPAPPCSAVYQALSLILQCAVPCPALSHPVLRCPALPVPIPFYLIPTQPSQVQSSPAQPSLAQPSPALPCPDPAFRPALARSLHLLLPSRRALHSALPLALFSTLSCPPPCPVPYPALLPIQRYVIHPTMLLFLSC